MIYVFGKFDRSNVGDLEKTAVAVSAYGKKTTVFGEADDAAVARMTGEKINAEFSVPYPPDETEIEEVLASVAGDSVVVTDLSGEIEAGKYVFREAKLRGAKTVLMFPTFDIPEAIGCVTDVAVLTAESVAKITGFTVKTEVETALAAAALFSAGPKAAVIIGDEAIVAENREITCIRRASGKDTTGGAAEFVINFADGTTVRKAAEIAFGEDSREVGAGEINEKD